MTMISDPHLTGSGRPPPTLASPIQSLSRAIRLARAEWRRRQNERTLEALPAEIRKDIGWPTTNAPANQQ